jgi:deoxycytidylate deaminase
MEVIMDIHLKRFEFLKPIAEDVSPVRGARLSAMLVFKGKIVSIGVNQYKSHPFAAKYAKNKDAIYLHAEADCILKASRKLTEAEMKKATLYVCRVKYNASSNGKIIFGKAKPCDGCEDCIRAHGIKKVIYTEESTMQKTSFISEFYH